MEYSEIERLTALVKAEIRKLKANNRHEILLKIIKWQKRKQ